MKLSWVSLIKTLIIFTELHPHDLIASQRTPPLDTITLGVSTLTYEFGIGENTNIQS